MRSRKLLSDKLSPAILVAVLLFALPVVGGAAGKNCFYVQFGDLFDKPGRNGSNAFGWLVSILPIRAFLQPDVSKIAFTGFRTGSFRSIYIMNADGTNTIRLTNSSGNDEHPSISSTGKIAFSSTRDFNSEIYVMDADGTNQVRLTANQAGDIEPTFSPDGTKIAFSTSRTRPDQTTFQGICVINVNGTNETCLDNGTRDFEPSFGPNGKLAFVSQIVPGSSVFNICVMNDTGSNRTCLPSDHDYNAHPTFSPDGSKIAYQSLASGGSSGGLYVMNADGSNRTQISTSTGDTQPSWGGLPPVIIGPTKLKVTGGDILVGSPGQGIILRSSGGATCRQLSINNAGAMVLTAVTCP